MNRFPVRIRGALAPRRSVRLVAAAMLAAAGLGSCGSPTPTEPATAPDSRGALLCGWGFTDCGDSTAAVVGAQNQAPLLRFKTNPPADKSGPVWTLTGVAPFAVMFNLCESSDPDQVIDPDGTQNPSGDQIDWQFNFGDPASYQIGADGTPTPDPAANPDGSFRADFGGFCRIAHTYEAPGAYIATVSVTDKHLEDQAHDVSAQARQTQRVRILLDPAKGREPCFYNSSRNLSAGLIGPMNVFRNVEFFFDDDRCLGPAVRLTSSSFIVAGSLGEARAVCQNFGTVAFVDELKNIGFDAPRGYYGCDAF